MNFTIIEEIETNQPLGCPAEEQPVPQGGKASDYSIKEVIE